MIFQQIMSNVSPGTTIPGTKYTVKGIGNRHGERALVYRISRRASAKHASEKGIPEAEFEQAYSQLVTTGQFTTKWFEANVRSAHAAPSIP